LKSLKYLIVIALISIALISGGLWALKYMGGPQIEETTIQNQIAPTTLLQTAKAETLNSNTEPGKYTLTVRGYGSAFATPNMVSIVLSVSTPTPLKDPVEAYTQVVKVARDAIDAIKSIEGVKSITTLQFNIRPEYSWYEGKRHFEGYIATYKFKVDVEDINATGEVLKVAIEKGVNIIEGVSLTFSKDLEESLYMEALKNAVNNAEEKAKLVADELGVTITGVKSVIVESYYIPPQYREYDIYLKAAEAMAVPPAPIEVSEVKVVSVTVQVVFEISG